MPTDYHNYLVRPDWDTTRKVASRIDTIIGPYRRLFSHNVPEFSQYWSMCGAHYRIDKQGVTPIAGEMMQAVKAGLITPNQYIGVDREKTIIDTNANLYPDTTWIHGDFKQSMADAAMGGMFRPSIINYDGVMGPKFGTAYLKNLMQFFDHNVASNMLLVCNFVLKSPYRKANEVPGYEVIGELLKLYMPPDHWSLYPEYYMYSGGSGNRSRTQMGSFIFVKRGTNLNCTPGRRLDDI